MQTPRPGSARVSDPSTGSGRRFGFGKKKPRVQTSVSVCGSSWCCLAATMNRLLEIDSTAPDRENRYPVRNTGFNMTASDYENRFLSLLTSTHETTPVLPGYAGGFRLWDLLFRALLQLGLIHAQTCSSKSNSQFEIRNHLPLRAGSRPPLPQASCYLSSRSRSDPF